MSPHTPSFAFLPRGTGVIWARWTQIRRQTAHPGRPWASAKTACLGLTAGHAAGPVVRRGRVGGPFGVRIRGERARLALGTRAGPRNGRPGAAGGARGGGCGAQKGSLTGSDSENFQLLNLLDLCSGGSISPSCSQKWGQERETGRPGPRTGGGGGFKGGLGPKKAKKRVGYSTPVSRVVAHRSTRGA